MMIPWTDGLSAGALGTNPAFDPCEAHDASIKALDVAKTAAIQRRRNSPLVPNIVSPSNAVQERTIDSYVSSNDLTLALALEGSGAS
jgi:hypothetical protein